MRSNAEWQEWGKRDPFYAVAAWSERQKGGTQPWTADEFYATGASDWDDYFRHWKSYGVDRDCCVEIGCGAGRLTKALVDGFQQVIAVDVSPDMIALAQENAPGTASFYVTDGLDLPLPDASASAAFSTFVFQHFDSIAEANAVLRDVSRVLLTGGTLMVQLPVHSWPGNARPYRLLYRTQKLLGNVRARARRRGLHQAAVAPFMRHLSYEGSELIATLGALGFVDVELRSFFVRSNRSFQTFVFARRGAT